MVEGRNSEESDGLAEIADSGREIGDLLRGLVLRVAIGDRLLAERLVEAGDRTRVSPSSTVSCGCQLPHFVAVLGQELANEMGVRLKGVAQLRAVFCLPRGLSVGLVL